MKRFLVFISLNLFLFMFFSIFLNLFSNFLFESLITDSTSRPNFLDRLIQEKNKSPI